MPICPNCGVTVTGAYCPSCGRAMNAQQPPQQQPPQQQQQNNPYYAAPAPYSAPNPEASLPEQYKPLSMWAYWGLSLLYSLPLVGFIMLIVHSCDKSNINRKNFACSYWCWYIVIAAIALVILVLSLAGVASLGVLNH